MQEHSKDDERFLRSALDLARRGVALAAPNPCVGAVIVDGLGEVIGEGFHTYEGVKHAEVLALEHASVRAKGATVYVTLEPCSHQGRTGPCVEALVAAGVGRVVACMQDPNPQVAGNGFARLRAAGIEVSVGGLEEEARRLNESFAKFIRTGLPLVTLKAAMTLDGKIAPPPGTSHAPGGFPITGDEARTHVQKLRHQSDAILVGVGTVIADDPLLTDRSGKARRRPLLRVVLDSHLRIPVESRIVQTAKDDVLVLYSLADDKEEKKEHLQERGVRAEQISPSAIDGRPKMEAVVRHLGTDKITSLIIEGGSHINGAALSAGIVDKCFLYYAPTIFSGGNSIPFASGPGFEHFSDSPRVKNVRLHRFGEDFAVEGYFRDPYA